MKQRPFFPAAALAATCLAAMPASATAMTMSVMPQSISSAAMKGSRGCASSVSPGIGQVARSAAGAGMMNKSSAILGGRVSALEMLKRQQAGNAIATTTADTTASLAPATPPSRLNIYADCSRFAAATPTSLGGRPVGRSLLQAPDDFLASKRIRVRRTSFDRSWRRVRKQGLSPSVAASMTKVGSGRVNMATLTAVNAWTNSRIKYVEDRVLYGRDDYWASARTTLRRRAGDCEDIAIAKLQLLAAAGVPKSDMYLTVARDLARNADHAVLVVKLDGRFWMLDNSTSKVLDASRSHDYQPIMSFSTSRRWIHGYAQM